MTRPNLSGKPSHATHRQDEPTNTHLFLARTVILDGLQEIEREWQYSWAHWQKCPFHSFWHPDNKRLQMWCDAGNIEPDTLLVEAQRRANLRARRRAYLRASLRARLKIGELADERVTASVSGLPLSNERRAVARWLLGRPKMSHCRPLGFLEWQYRPSLTGGVLAGRAVLRV